MSARARLAAAGIATPDREAEWILLHALEIPRESLWADPQERLAPEEEERLEAFVGRRAAREPLQLILGEVPFHGVALGVRPGVFLPRPETELLVDAVLDRMGSHPGSVLLDWGTGTGALAIALLHARPEWRGVAADQSLRALELARENAAKNGVLDRLTLLRADFTSPGGSALPGAPFDLVVSNPPYVRRDELQGLMPEVKDHDPVEALDGGPDGLDAFRHIALGIRLWLRPNGILALEIGADQADPVVGLFSGLLEETRVLPDQAGLMRIMIGTRRGG